jgi:hypothetical protein
MDGPRLGDLGSDRCGPGGAPPPDGARRALPCRARRSPGSSRRGARIAAEARIARANRGLSSGASRCVRARYRLGRTGCPAPRRIAAQQAGAQTDRGCGHPSSRPRGRTDGLACRRRRGADLLGRRVRDPSRIGMDTRKGPPSRRGEGRPGVVRRGPAGTRRPGVFPSATSSGHRGRVGYGGLPAPRTFAERLRSLGAGVQGVRWALHRPALPAPGERPVVGPGPGRRIAAGSEGLGGFPGYGAGPPVGGQRRERRHGPGPHARPGGLASTDQMAPVRAGRGNRRLLRRTYRRRSLGDASRSHGDTDSGRSVAGQGRAARPRSFRPPCWGCWSSIRTWFGRSVSS